MGGAGLGDGLGDASCARFWARSVLIRARRSWARVRRRVGIINPRGPSTGGVVVAGMGSLGRHKAGTNSLLPGWVVYVWPVMHVELMQ